ncbi:response regulator transcription factor [Microbacterium sp. RG1]|uniref:response regulator transcription factor n=1 Tax=Microbacterium sp. RG1 TaxID=2489212 RepID=UPI0010CA53E5|nr:response regulator transcription factor [Microbacterium sp. RG1]QCQ15712.1 response regulator transcription factor [Microbacterium sp. RG1]
MNPQPIRVLVADDQAIVRDGLVTILGLLDDVSVVGEASDGVEAITLALSERPDVVLMDLRMPGLSGADATARLTRDAPEIAVLVLTTYADDDSIADALRAGARGYLTKDAGRAELEAAIHSVARGQSVFASDVGARLVRAATGAPPPAVRLTDRFPALTARESDVLALVARGRNNHEIASELFVSVATVKSHINTIFAKLGVRDRAAAVALVLSGDG